MLLFPLAYQGHINPMFQLAGVLHARGFAVTVFHTHFNAPDPARHPDYRFVPVPDGMSGPAPAAIKDIFTNVFALNGACEAPFRDRLAAVLDEYSRDAVVCLVADVFLLSMVEVATRLAVPTLVLRTGSAASFAGFVAYPLLCEKGYLPVQESQLDVPVSELPPYRVRDLMHIGRAGHDLACEMLARAVAAVKASSGIILNTFDALERPELDKLRRDLAVPVFDIGPLHKFDVDGELETGRVEAAIRRLMTERDGAEMRARAGELKAAAAECTGKGTGSSDLAIDKMVTHMLSCSVLGRT